MDAPPTPQLAHSVINNNLRLLSWKTTNKIDGKPARITANVQANADSMSLADTSSRAMNISSPEFAKGNVTRTNNDRGSHENMSTANATLLAGFQRINQMAAITPGIN
jgi:hypothetical protein